MIKLCDFTFEKLSFFIRSSESQFCSFLCFIFITNDSQSLINRLVHGDPKNSAKVELSLPVLKED